MELRKGNISDPRNESYLFELDLTTGGYSVRHCFSPDVAYHPELLSGRAAVFSFGESNQLRIPARGDQIGFYLNGMPLTCISDQRPNGETNAFFISTENEGAELEVLIDNLRFWRLEP
jgi:hypothetical protein